MECRKLVLASKSPRRCELLTRFGIPFETFAPEVDESCSLPAGEAVEILSRRKALATASRFGDAFILAADTLVSLNGKTLGKPSGPEEASRMLSRLSGQTHQVFTGVTVIPPSGYVFTASDRTDVTFCDIPDEEILSYVATGDPLDKAGSYALQGRAALWVTRIEGCDTSVIGLPLYLVRRLLIRAGYPLAAAQHH
jgi:septum formation protein